MCDIGDCDIRAKQNTSQKTIPTAEDMFITENRNPYFYSVLHELTVIWCPPCLKTRRLTLIFLICCMKK